MLASFDCVSWAQALDENDDVERGRYLAARIGKLSDSATADFFAACCS